MIMQHDYMRPDERHMSVQETRTTIDLSKELANSAPEERAAAVLRAMDAHAQGRLELPSRDGAEVILDGIDLSPAALLARDDPSLPPPAWWDRDQRRVKLTQARLAGASLDRAILTSADLHGADLRDASLRGVNLEGAVLEGASLQHADLASARLCGASLGEANLTEALLEEADLRDAVLRFTVLQKAALEGASLQGADLWGANLDGAFLTGADLTSARLPEASLRQSDLSEANLRDTVFDKANLRGARLRGADLQGIMLRHADLTDAVLSATCLQDVDLSASTITRIHLAEARLDRTRLRRQQLGGAVGEEIAGEYAAAASAYLALEQNFSQLGDLDAATWAYDKRRRMQKLEERRLARRAWGARRWAEVAEQGGKFIGDQLAEWVCGYGESISRVLGSFLALYLLFAALYALSGSVGRDAGGPAGLFDLMAFSFLKMAAQETPGLAVRNEIGQILVGTQSLLTIFLVGLLGFVAGNRIRR